MENELNRLYNQEVILMLFTRSVLKPSIMITRSIQFITLICCFCLVFQNCTGLRKNACADVLHQKKLTKPKFENWRKYSFSASKVQSNHDDIRTSHNNSAQNLNDWKQLEKIPTSMNHELWMKDKLVLIEKKMFTDSIPDQNFDQVTNNEIDLLETKAQLEKESFEQGKIRINPAHEKAKKKAKSSWILAGMSLVLGGLSFLLLPGAGVAFSFLFSLIGMMVGITALKELSRFKDTDAKFGAFMAILVNVATFILIASVSFIVAFADF